MISRSKCTLAWLFAFTLSWTPHGSDGSASADDRPNILWIMSEDNSKHYLKHFDPNGIETPAIESLAEHGVTFDRAFSNAPVCSVARTTLITGCYGPRVGTQYHRRLAKAVLPASIRMFPSLLRDAGYYTTNNSKEDYNAIRSEGTWDQSSRKASWKNRPTTDTPFFHVQTFADSHESRLHFSESAMQGKSPETPLDQVHLPDYLPDTSLSRYTAAYYRDRMTVIDGHVAKIIDELRQADQLENTFVFYFGDHGGVLPRSKGYVYESGLHVPLVVRVPERFRSIVDRDLGSRTNGFVSFIDFGPTVLSLASVAVPESLDGQPFLGESVSAADVDARDRTFSYGDRMDAKYDLVRAVRIGDWKYIRSFEPFMPDVTWNDYRMKMLAYQQWQALHESGDLNAVQAQFFEPRQPELLFDLANDPDETHNLAGQSKHEAQLRLMRETLAQHMSSIHDLSLVPETVMIESAISDPVEFGIENADAIDRYLGVANSGLQPIDAAIDSWMLSLNSGDPWLRYWSIVAVSGASTDPQSLEVITADEALLKLLHRRVLDTEPLVCARAAEALALLAGEDPRPTLYRSLARAVAPAEALRICNIMTFLHRFAPTRYPIDVQQLQTIVPYSPKSELALRMDYFGAKAN
ncbi:MAG: sulfatase [Planctomycetota bacterium]